MSIKGASYITIKWLEKYVKTDVKYVIQNGFWINMNFILVSVLSLVLSILFANLLTKNEYGVYQYLLSISTLLAAFTYTGMNAAIIQSVARGYEGTFTSSIRPQFTWNLLPAFMAMVMSAYYFIQDNAVLGIGIAVIGLTLPILNTYNSYSAYLAGKKNFKASSIYAMLGNILYYGCMYVAIFFLPSALPLILINLVITSSFAFAAYMHVVRTTSINANVDNDAAPYARHLTVMNVLGTIANQIDNFLVFHFLGAANLAAYSLATLVPERLGGVFKSITSAALPRFAERHIDEIRGGMMRKVFMIIVASIVCIVLYVLIAPLLFAAIYPEYLDVITYSQFYSLTLIVVAANLVMTALYAQKRVRDLYILNTGVPVVQIVMQVVAIVLWGLPGLIASKIASSALMIVVTLALLRRD